MPSLPGPDPATQVRDFTSVVAAVTAHNNRFSPGATTARLVFDPRRRKQAASGDAAEPTLDDEQRLTRSILDLETKFTLAGMGLELSPLRTTETIYGVGAPQSVGEVRIAVSDGARFAKFLADTATPRARPDVAFHTAITSIAQDILTETTEAVAKGDPTAAEPLAYGAAIIAALKRHGLADQPAVAGLAELVRAAQAGYVHEYVAAKSAGILEKPGSPSFNPSTWQRDANTADLSQKWANVLTVIEAATANVDTQGFAASLVDQAAAHLSFALDDWPKVKEEREDGYGIGFDDIFAVVASQLDSLRSRFASDPAAATGPSPRAIPRPPHGLPEPGPTDNNDAGPTPFS